LLAEARELRRRSHEIEALAIDLDRRLSERDAARRARAKPGEAGGKI
jgi:hypothetical protein